MLTFAVNFQTNLVAIKLYSCDTCLLFEKVRLNYRAVTAFYLVTACYSNSTMQYHKLHPTCPCNVDKYFVNSPFRNCVERSMGIASRYMTLPVHLELVESVITVHLLQTSLLLCGTQVRQPHSFSEGKPTNIIECPILPHGQDTSTIMLGIGAHELEYLKVQKR